MKKLKQHTGETLAEVLIAVLVMVTAFVILTGAVVSAARINDRAKIKDASFTADGNRSIQVAFFGSGSDVSTSVSVRLYKDEDNGYYYYDHN